MVQWSWILFDEQSSFFGYWFSVIWALTYISWFSDFLIIFLFCLYSWNENVCECSKVENMTVVYSRREVGASVNFGHISSFIGLSLTKLKPLFSFGYLLPTFYNEKCRKFRMSGGSYRVQSTKYAWALAPPFSGETIHFTLEPSWPQLSIIMIRILDFVVYTKKMNLCLLKLSGKSCYRVNIGLVLLSGPCEEKSIVRYGGCS